ncbi:MAG: twin-arginine translocase TatA/TatE family subunit [Candidatus Acidiferrales bacterium]
MSPIHWMIVAVVILVLFGGRKIPEVMRGLGQGIKEFKEGMRSGESVTAPPPSAPAQASTVAPPAVAPPTEEKK